METNSSAEEIQKASGAVFELHRGRMLPAHFGSPAGEYKAAREMAAVFDCVTDGQVKVEGPDAAGFLHNLCTNDVKGLQPGCGCEAFLTTSQAKIVALVNIYRLPVDGPVYWVDAPDLSGSYVAKHLDHFLVSEALDIAEMSNDWRKLHVAGPRAAAYLSDLLNRDCGTLADLQVRIVMCDSGEFQIRHRSPLGLDGFDIIATGPAAVDWFRRLQAAGDQPAGWQAYETLRIEAGMPANGIDLDQSNLPQESGRTERAVSFNKGCYIGQETIARIRTYGHVNRLLVGVRLEGTEPVAAGAKMWAAGAEVGRLTSCTWSPACNGVIGLAMVRRGANEPGAPVEIDAGPQRRQAVLAALPFVSVNSRGA